MSDTTSDATVAEEGGEAPAMAGGGTTMNEDGSITIATADGDEVDTIPSPIEAARAGDEARAAAEEDDDDDEVDDDEV